MSDQNQMRDENCNMGIGMSLDVTLRPITASEIWRSPHLWMGFESPPYPPLG